MKVKIHDTRLSIFKFQIDPLMRDEEQNKIMTLKEMAWKIFKCVDYLEHQL